MTMSVNGFHIADRAVYAKRKRSILILLGHRS
jgi:hypothetical protein